MSELTDYLMAMITPPAHFDRPVNLGDLATVDWEGMATWASESITGFVIGGEPPTEEQAKELMRLLKPGGHMAVIAPDSQPTGHSGAILLEDSGFEIRDCILWVRGPGRTHYVSKASRSEREAGCGHLKGKAGHEAVERKEGSAGVDNPRAGAGRTAEHVKNHHPTVKAIGIMERLIAPVPKDHEILDPFMGSGTTAIACSKTGHSFTGIEREAEYLAIADARVRHWDSAHQGWIGADIESDHAREDVDVAPMSLEDLFD